MGRGGIILLVLILIVAAVAVFFTFFYHPTCDDTSCWEDRLENCRKSKYINDAIDVTWEYKIKGDKGDKCIVDVKILAIKRGLKKTEVLEGKTMTCELPKGIILAPEANTNFCHGILKEEFQNLIIKNLYNFVLENTGEIGQELREIEGLGGVDVVGDVVNNSSIDASGNSS